MMTANTLPEAPAIRKTPAALRAEPVIEFTVTVHLTATQARQLQYAIYKSARLPEALVDKLVNDMDLQELAANRRDIAGY